jgi:chromosome segregation ATPase
MGLLDDYQNMDETTDETSSGIDPAAARRKRSDLERQIVILDSDLRKTQREIEQYEIEKRRLKKDEERIRIDRDDLDKKLKNLDNDRVSLEDQIRLLKKKLKTLI